MNNSFKELEYKLELGSIEAAIQRLEKEDLQPHDIAYINAYRKGNKDERAINQIKPIIKTLAEIFEIKAEIGNLMNYK